MTTTLITGSSSGIGEDLALRFAAGGDDVVLVARSEGQLNQLADRIRQTQEVSAVVICSDLSSVEGVDHVISELSRRNISVDTLVNNAGFGALGDFAKLDVDRQIDMVMVNVTALTKLTRLLLPSMIERDRGGVLNVGSIAGYQAGPKMAVYYATKAYVLSFTEGLREELSETGLHVTLLAPGATRTGFGEDSGMGDLDMFQRGAMTSQQVADDGYAGYKANRAVVIPGWQNRLLVTSTRFLPRWATRKIVGKLQGNDGR